MVKNLDVASVDLFPHRSDLEPQLPLFMMNHDHMLLAIINDIVRSIHIDLFDIVDVNSCY
jgi:hypothetical protein